MQNNTAMVGATVLRIALGVLFLSHAGLKIFVFTPAGTAQFFESVGVPGFVAYLVMTLEALGGIALILGIYTRLAALALIIPPLGAIAAVHGGAGFFFNNPNGGWEFPAFWIVVLIVQALIGDGAYALKPAPLPGAAMGTKTA